MGVVIDVVPSLSPLVVRVNQIQRTQDKTFYRYEKIDTYFLEWKEEDECKNDSGNTPRCTE